MAGAAGGVGEGDVSEFSGLGVGCAGDRVGFGGGGIGAG